MADLRDVKCLTVSEMDAIRQDNQLRCSETVARLVDRNDVAVAALRKCWFIRMQIIGIVHENSLEYAKRWFCETRGLTMQQAHDLGIFAETET